MQNQFTVRLQTLQPLSSLSASSLAVTGGTVGTIMAVEGSQNKEFDVDISADRGTKAVSVGTRSGVPLVANSLTIQIDSGNPQVCSHGSSPLPGTLLHLARVCRPEVYILQMCTSSLSRPVQQEWASRSRLWP